MELDGHQILPAGRRTEPRAILRLANEVPYLFRFGIVRMDEVERLTVQTIEDGVTPHQRQLVPPDMRNLEPVTPEAHHPPRHKTQPLHTGRLLGALEDHLQRDANPEKRLSRPERLPASLIHPALPQLPHAVPESPHARQHHGISREHPLRIGRQIHPRPDLLQRPRNGERVARIVVHDRYAQAGQHSAISISAQVSTVGNRNLCNEFSDVMVRRTH